MSDAVRRFFGAAREAFETARERSPSLERTFGFADQALRLRFASAELERRVTPAFEHLAVDEETVASLTIGLWDSASTGVAMPPPPWSWDEGLGRGEIPGLESETLRVAFHVDSGTLCMLDQQRRLALYWVRDARRLPYYESAAPLRTLLHWWLGAHGFQLTHAAAIGGQAGGALLVGRSGSGKSTTALACLCAGLGYVGDDYCIVGSCAPHAWSAYSTGKLDTKGISHFPDLLPHVANPDRVGDEKAVVYFHRSHRERVLRDVPLRAVILPRISPAARSRLRPTSAAKALLALAPSTMLQLVQARTQTLELLSDVVSQAPCYELELGTDRAEAAAVVRELLQ